MKEEDTAKIHYFFKLYFISDEPLLSLLCHNIKLDVMHRSEKYKSRLMQRMMII